jgi:superfamily II helicase
VAITDKIYVKNHRQLATQLDRSFPRSAFAGATLEALFGAEGLTELDQATRERVLDFAEAFMDCGCQSAPHCGHPERKFLGYLLELRAGGLGPDAMVDAMTADYMVYAYPGDVRSFLDDAVRTLDAVEALAEVEGNDEVADRARERRRALL